MKFLRWFSTPIAFLTLCGIVPLLGYFIVGWLDRFCAPEQFTAGSCVASWHAPAIDAIIYGALFVLSLLLVTIPAAIAPSGKKITAILAFSCWAVILLGISSLSSVLPGALGIGWTELAVPFLIAAAGGGIGLMLVRSRVARTV